MKPWYGLAIEFPQELQWFPGGVQMVKKSYREMDCGSPGKTTASGK